MEVYKIMLLSKCITKYLDPLIFNPKGRKKKENPKDFLKKIDEKSVKTPLSI